MTTSDTPPSGINDPRSTDELTQRLSELGRSRKAEGDEWIAIQRELSSRRLHSGARDPEAEPSTPPPLRRQILDVLHKTPGQTPSELAQTLETSASVVSRVLAALVNEGSVTFDQDPDDGRRRPYRLQPNVAYERVASAGDGDLTETQETEEYLGLVISGAVTARRSRNDLSYAADRLSRALIEAQVAESPHLALIARRELITTLRQSRRQTEYANHVQALVRFASGVEPLPQQLMLPATGCLEYERGRDPALSARERLEYLTASAAAFRMCEDAPNSEDWCSREGWALIASAELWRETTEFGVALTLATRAAGAFRAYDDTYGAAEAHRLKGFCHRLRGEFPAAIESLVAAEELASASGSDRCRADILLQLGEAHRCEGFLKAARDYLSEAADMAIALDRLITRGFALSGLAAVDFEQSDLEGAWKLATEAEHCLRASAQGRALNERRCAVIARELAKDTGSHDMRDSCLQLFNIALTSYRAMRSPAGVAACYVGLGRFTAGVESVEPTLAVDGLVSLGRTRLGKLLLPIDPWVPTLLSVWADEVEDPSIRQLAAWASSTDIESSRADEMAGEPRYESDLLAV